MFNPTTQGKKFDPDGEYVREWVPELRGVDGRRGARAVEAARGPPADYPAPIVDHAAERKVALDDFHRARGQSS